MRASSNLLRPLSLSALFKFTALASLFAIFADAAIAHAMLWGNDPYWTYWVTDTLLMATVFGLGTAWVGIGAGRGSIRASSRICSSIKSGRIKSIIHPALASHARREAVRFVDELKRIA